MIEVLVIRVCIVEALDRPPIQGNNHLCLFLTRCPPTPVRADSGGADSGGADSGGHRPVRATFGRA